MLSHRTCHSYYVNVVTSATGPTALLTMSTLHILVTSSHSSFHYGSTSTITLVIGALGWIHENSHDDSTGVHTYSASLSLMSAIALLIISEALLFVTVLWVVILHLVTTSALMDSSIACAAVHAYADNSSHRLLTVANALTAINTATLVCSSVTVVLGVHTITRSIQCHGILMLAITIVLATGFAAVQCVEYLHLYWTLCSSSTTGLLYVVTGIHGAHVLVGCIAITMYMITVTHWHVYAYATCTTLHLLVGIVGYWHLVDIIWLCVVVTVYWVTITL
uniref:Cytochrome c oxidase subunit 3 n=1 Tax=Diplonema sp. ATCC 50224 TaxID=91375 RepID=A0A2D2AJT6_9EUGL|nr:cytochrome c oxidase subunit 3 [Diplonema sp. ATCC 50224]